MARGQRKFGPPTCHPHLPSYAKGLCAACYHRKAQGLTGPAYQRARLDAPLRGMPTDLPPRILDVQQFTAMSFPLVGCPHCGRHNSLSYDGREAWCRGVRGGCGRTVYLVSATETVTKKQAFKRPSLVAAEIND